MAEDANLNFRFLSQQAQQIGPYLLIAAEFTAVLTTVDMNGCLMMHRKQVQADLFINEFGHVNNYSYSNSHAQCLWVVVRGIFGVDADEGRTRVASMMWQVVTARKSRKRVHVQVPTLLHVELDAAQTLKRKLRMLIENE